MVTGGNSLQQEITAQEQMTHGDGRIDQVM